MEGCVFFSSRNSPDECSMAKGGKMVGSPDTVGMNYSSYMEDVPMQLLPVQGEPERKEETSEVDK